MTLLHVPTKCLWRAVSLIHVPVTCPCYMSLTHVPAFCPCLMICRFYMCYMFFLIEQQYYLQKDTIQYNMYNNIQYNTIQYNTLHYLHYLQHNTLLLTLALRLPFTYFLHHFSTFYILFYTLLFRNSFHFAYVFLLHVPTTFPCYCPNTKCLCYMKLQHVPCV